MSNKENILICGGTGFVGQNLVKQLVNDGRKINLLLHENLPKSLEGLKESITIFKGDLLNKKSLVDPVNSSDIIINLVGSFFKDIHPLNFTANYNLLEVCKNHNPKKIIFTSSQSVYGEKKNKPFEETDEPCPITDYGLMKLLAEEMYKFYSYNHNIPSVILRLSNVYGPMQRKGVIFNFINSALADKEISVHDAGKQKRDYVYVDDVVDGMVKSIDYKSKNFEILNLAGPGAYSLLDVIDCIKTDLKKEIKSSFVSYNEPDIRCSWSNYEKAKKLLGYTPKVNLEEGIHKTIIYFKRKDYNPA